MKKKAFMTFGIILVFAILAIPKGISTLETKGVIGELACFLQSSVEKAFEQLRSFFMAAMNNV
jgi:hypothetical protein